MSAQQRCNSCGDNLQLSNGYNSMGTGGYHENSSYAMPGCYHGHNMRYCSCRYQPQHLENAVLNTQPHYNVYSNQLHQRFLGSDFQSPAYYPTNTHHANGNCLPSTNYMNMPRNVHQMYPTNDERASMNNVVEQYPLPSDCNPSPPCITLSFCCMPGYPQPTIEAPANFSDHFVENVPPDPVTRRWNKSNCDAIETNNHFTVPNPTRLAHKNPQDNRPRRCRSYRNSMNRETPKNTVSEIIKHKHHLNDVSHLYKLPSHVTDKSHIDHSSNEIKQELGEEKPQVYDLSFTESSDSSTVTCDLDSSPVSVHSNPTSVQESIEEKRTEFSTVQELQAEFDQIMNSFKKSCSVHGTFSSDPTEMNKGQTKVFEALCELTEEYCQRLRVKWNILIRKMEHASLEEEKVKKIVQDLREKLASQKKIINQVFKSTCCGPDASGDSSNVGIASSDTRIRIPVRRSAPEVSTQEKVTTDILTDSTKSTENQDLQSDASHLNSSQPPTYEKKKSEHNCSNFVPFFIPPQVEMKHAKYVSQMYEKQHPQYIKDQRLQKSRVFYSNYQPVLKQQYYKPKEYVTQNTDPRNKYLYHGYNASKTDCFNNSAYVSAENNSQTLIHPQIQGGYFHQMHQQVYSNKPLANVCQTSFVQKSLPVQISDTLSVSYPFTGRWSSYMTSLCSLGGDNIERIGPLARANHPAIFCLGKSKFGIVELALDLNNKVPVAVKHINVSTSVLLPLLAPLLTFGNTEAPPHLVKYLALLVDSKWPTSSLLALTLCEWNLSEYMDHIQSTLPPEDLQATFMRIIAEMLEGLKFLHSLRPVVSHGNLKPTNILVDKEQRVRLADYGIIQELYKMRQVDSSEAMWWSRETLEGLNDSGIFRISPSSDVQSAGMVIHFVLANKAHPFGFSQATPVDIVNNIISRRSALSPELSNDVCSLLSDMLNGDPYKRPTAYTSLSKVWIWDYSRKWCF